MKKQYKGYAYGFKNGMIFVIFATSTATLPLFKGELVFAGGTKFMQEKNELQTGSKEKESF